MIKIDSFRDYLTITVKNESIFAKKLSALAQITPLSIQLVSINMMIMHKALIKTNISIAGFSLVAI